TLISILSIIFLSSCSMLREGIHGTADQLEVDSVHNLEGNYVNHADTFVMTEFRGKSYSTQENCYLWNTFSTHNGKIDHSKWEKCLVQIDFITDKKARVSLIYEDSIIDSRKIRGKF